MIKFPTVHSVGAPPQQYADRIVAEMLQLIVAARLEFQDRMDAVLNLPDGNPKAQEKIAKKLEAASYPFILSAQLGASSKRGRYVLNVWFLDGWDPVRKDPISEAEAIPAKPWITCNHMCLTSYGQHKYREVRVTPLFITHHALSRLVQRSNVRTVVDLLHAVVKISLAFINRSHDKGPDFQDDQRMTFALGAGGNAIAVLKHYDEDNEQHKHSAVVATIL